MTLVVVFGIITLLGVGLCIWQIFVKGYSEWRMFVGGTTIGCAGLALIILLCMWLPSNKNSVIVYSQLLAEKQTIEAMLETDKDVDRFLLNTAVVEYNNKIIKMRVNSTRIIFKDYYDQSIAWQELEPIIWK